MGTAAARQRRYRARQRAGQRVLRVAVDEAALADALVRTGYLDGLAADDPAALAQAVEAVLARLVALDWRYASRRA